MNLNEMFKILLLIFVVLCFYLGLRYTSPLPSPQSKWSTRFKFWLMRWIYWIALRGVLPYSIVTYLFIGLPFGLSGLKRSQDDPEVMELRNPIGNCPECDGFGTLFTNGKKCPYCRGRGNVGWIGNIVELPDDEE